MKKGANIRLVVERIDGDAFLPVDAVQERVGRNLHRVRGFVARRVLRVFDAGAFVLCPDVLIDCATEGERHHLNAFADAEYGQLAVGSHAAEEQFALVALGVDAVKF